MATPGGSKTKNIHERVTACIADCGPAEKTGTPKPGVNFEFFKTDDVVSHLRTWMKHHRIGFSYTVVDHLMDVYESTETYKGDTKIRRLFVTTKTVSFQLTNLDDPEDYITGKEVGYGFDYGDKGPGKATSYAVKTWLLNAFQLRGQPDVENFPEIEQRQTVVIPPTPASKLEQAVAKAKLALVDEVNGGIDHLKTVWSMYPAAVRDEIMTKHKGWWDATKKTAQKIGAAV